MMCATRSLLISTVFLAAAAGTAMGKGKPPHPPRVAPRHLALPRVNRHPRPIVYRGPARHVPRAATRIVRQPVRRTAIRTVHRYPVHRVPYRFVRRPRYYGVNSYYPGRYWRRTNHNRRYGALQRHRARLIGGIVESVQGNPTGGALLVKVFRPRHSRFRYARRNAVAGSATSLRRFQLINGTLYEVMTIPPRGGTILDLHKGEHVLVLTHANGANVAQMVRVSPRRRR